MPYSTNYYDHPLNSTPAKLCDIEDFKDYKDIMEDKFQKGGKSMLCASDLKTLVVKGNFENWSDESTIVEFQIEFCSSDDRQECQFDKNNETLIAELEEYYFTSFFI